MHAPLTRPMQQESVAAVFVSLQSSSSPRIPLKFKRNVINRVECMYSFALHACEYGNAFVYVSIQTT